MVWRIYIGAALLIAGIAAFIEAHTHRPKPATVAVGPGETNLSSLFPGPTKAAGLSPTAYDLLHIAAWALVILGALTVLIGLIRLAQPTLNPQGEGNRRKPLP